MKVNFKILYKDCEVNRFGEGKAHAGFLAYYKTVRNALTRHLDELDVAGKEVVLTGHRLGGACGEPGPTAEGVTSFALEGSEDKENGASTGRPVLL